MKFDLSSFFSDVVDDDGIVVGNTNTDIYDSALACPPLDDEYLYGGHDDELIIASSMTFGHVDQSYFRNFKKPVHEDKYSLNPGEFIVFDDEECKDDHDWKQRQMYGKGELMSLLKEFQEDQDSPKPSSEIVDDQECLNHDREQKQIHGRGKSMSLLMKIKEDQDSSNPCAEVFDDQGFRDHKQIHKHGKGKSMSLLKKLFQEGLESPNPSAETVDEEVQDHDRKEKPMSGKGKSLRLLKKVLQPVHKQALQSE